ncbi:MAG: hypothetical protein GX561_13545 [Lentisphaerae bacterium]|jgi:hypothetical protein|nr:hypothetical protein [Lentisphaerota bacterium]
MKKSVLATAFLCATLVANAQNQTICEVNAGNLREPVDSVGTTGKFSGVLPVGMSENFSHWMTGECVGEAKTDTLGDPYVSLNMVKAGTQFAIPLNNPKAKTRYKATFIIRNRLSLDATGYLRQGGEPYKDYNVQFKIERSDDFKTFVYPFMINAFHSEKDNTGLYFTFSQVGKLDLKLIKIEEISEKEYELLELQFVKRIIRKEPGTDNFLANSSLPKGLQSGWAQLGGNNYCRSKVFVDESVRGPSGEFALCLDSTSDRNVGIASPPFVASVPHESVTVSFSYRGNGTFSTLISANWGLVRAKLEPSETEWKRATLTAKLPVRRMGATFRIEGQGKLHVDAFRVADEGQGDYKPAGQHEISFFLPKSDADVARIQFQDEPSRIGIYLTGESAGATIKCTVTDLYGKTVSLPDLRDKENVFDYHSDLGLAPLGQYRIECQAFRGDVPASPISEFVVTRIPRPRHWGKDAPDSPFGMHTNQLESNLRALKAGGFNWARCHDGARFITCWYYMEPEKGKWDFQDDQVMAYRNNNIMLYGQLAGAPIWASNLKNLPEKYHRSYPSVFFAPLPEYEDDFVNYCETMAKRYRGIIDDWFIWNEPYSSLFFHKDQEPNTGKYIAWDSLEETGKAFAHYSKLAYKGAKAGNPNCRITGFGTAGAPWANAVYDGGAYDFCEEMDFHCYYNSNHAGFPGDPLAKGVETIFEKIFAEKGRDTKPIIMSEGQAGSASTRETEPRAGMYKNTITWQSIERPTTIANSNMRYILSYLASGIKKIYLYTAHGYTDFSRGTDLQIILSADGSPHPVLVAHAALAYRLEDMKFIQYHKLGDTNVYAMIFSDGTRSVAAISSEGMLKATINVNHKAATCSDIYGNTIPNAFDYDGTISYVQANCKPDELKNAIMATAKEDKD